MKHYYAIAHTSHSWNDSDEKIRDWKTATVYRFNTKQARDEFCEGEQYHHHIDAKRANYIGWTDHPEENA